MGLYTCTYLPSLGKVIFGINKFENPWSTMFFSWRKCHGVHISSDLSAASDRLGVSAAVISRRVHIFTVLWWFVFQGKNTKHLKIQSFLPRGLVLRGHTIRAFEADKIKDPLNPCLNRSLKKKNLLMDLIGAFLWYSIIYGNWNDCKNPFQFCIIFNLTTNFWGLERLKMTIFTNIRLQKMSTF